VSEQLNANDRAKHKATLKDKIARAKRILKSITPDLLEAAGREADLGLRSRDEECHNISSILESALRPSADFAPSHTDGETHDTASEGGGEEQQVYTRKNGEPSLGNASDKLTNAKENIEMTDADDKNVLNCVTGNQVINGIHNGHAQDEASQHPEPLADSGNDHPTSPRATPSYTTPSLNIPALSNSGSTNPSSTHEPFTPPHGDKDLSTLSNGGVMWYLEAFEPIGTTIHDPKEESMPDDQLSAKQTLREISEELSELDDEAVNGLVDGLEKRPVLKAGTDTLNVPIVVPKKKAKSKKRR